MVSWSGSIINLLMQAAESSEPDVALKLSLSGEMSDTMKIPLSDEGRTRATALNTATRRILKRTSISRLLSTAAESPPTYPAKSSPRRGRRHSQFLWKVALFRGNNSTPRSPLDTRRVGSTTYLTHSSTSHDPSIEHHRLDGRITGNLGVCYPRTSRRTHRRFGVRADAVVSGPPAGARPGCAGRRTAVHPLKRGKHLLNFTALSNQTSEVDCRTASSLRGKNSLN